MRSLIFSLFIILISGPALANPVHDTLPVYAQRELLPGEKVVMVPVNFDASLLLKNIPDSLNGLAITQVDLVYTTYKSSPSFNQQALNQSRINRLAEHWPQTQNDMIEWNIVGQSQATSDPEARKLFHGFVIYYRPAPTTESIEAEISFLDNYLGIVGDVELESIVDRVIEPVLEPEELTTSSIVAPAVMHVPSEREREDGLHIEGKVCYVVKQINRDMEKKEVKRIADSLSHLPGFLSSSYTMGKGDKAAMIVWAERSDDCDSDKKPDMIRYDVVHGDGVSRSVTYDYPYMNNDEYGVVESVFKRHPSWINAVVVMDVTGSMSPYIAKTMAWVKSAQDSAQIKAFVFFNDGNHTPDSDKRTGEVGGIYFTANSNFADVYSRMKLTMQKGGGGDCPENNVEAAIEGITLYPDAGEIIMVADNYATPRDLALVKELKRPVHVILCGASAGVNLAYIQLAYDTGGSVHTIEEDMDLRGIEAGKTFKLGGLYYTLHDGKIVKTHHN